MWFILLFLTVLISLIIFSGAYVFVKACVRRKELPWMEEDKIKKTGFGRYYNCIVASDAWLREHNAEDVFITTADGLRLHAFWVPAATPRGTILLAHGYRSTFLVDFGLAFAFYHALGMNILVPNQRSHGKSQGRYITFGVKESEDMKSWISFHNKTFGPHQIILSGLSMGASTMLYLADQVLPENVKCIIADCGFTSPYAILEKVFWSITHLPAGPTLWTTDLFARLIAGFSLTGKDSRICLQNAKLPVLMVHGLADDFVPSEMTIQGYNACNSEKELVLVENAGHGVSFLVNKDLYINKVLEFLEKHLENF